MSTLQLVLLSLCFLPGEYSAYVSITSYFVNHATNPKRTTPIKTVHPGSSQPAPANRGNPACQCPRLANAPLAIKPLSEPSGVSSNHRYAIR